MPVIIPNDPTWGFLTFGDTDGALGGHSHAAAQVIHDVDASASTSRVATQVGDARALTDHALGGSDDLLIANRQNATIFGDAFELSGHARGGDDAISASGEFAATAFGDGRTLTDHAQGGDDTLTGASSFGSVRLYGDGEMLGDHARGGDDLLISGQGADDRMWGDAAVVSARAGAGADTFQFGPANGQDRIEDFEPGKDHIVLHQTAYHSFADLEGILQTTADGALLQFDAENSILAVGVAQLTAGDFLFT